MMKIAILLIAIISAITIHSSQGQCFNHFTSAVAGPSGGQTFGGITNGTTTEDYNNPIWYTLANAQTGLSVAAKGRLSGSLDKATLVGPLKFTFFARRRFFFFFRRPAESISFTFTKATGAATITGGTGCYSGITGTATRTRIGNSTPAVFDWKFCPPAAISCTPI